MFWITAAICVAILLILAQIASVRAWAARVFGRVAPDLSGLSGSIGRIGGALATISGKGWVRLLAIPLVVAGVWAIVSYIEGVGAGRERLEAERLNTEVAKHEADLGAFSAELAERTQTRARRADAIVAQADQDLEDAVSQDDFDALYRAYRNGYDGLWDDLRPSDSPDPSEGRPARLPGARAHAS